MLALAARGAMGALLRRQVALGTSAALFRRHSRRSTCRRGDRANLQRVMPAACFGQHHPRALLLLLDASDDFTQFTVDFVRWHLDFLGSHLENPAPDVWILCPISSSSNSRALFAEMVCFNANELPCPSMLWGGALNLSPYSSRRGSRWHGQKSARFAHSPPSGERCFSVGGVR